MTQNQTNSIHISKQKNLHLPHPNRPNRHGASCNSVAYSRRNSTCAGDQISRRRFSRHRLSGIGHVSVSLSTNHKRQAAQVKIEVPKVMTTIECTNKGCNNKTVREFQRGDYVYKELDVPCRKCGGKQMITAIYKEVKEKEKTYNV